MIKYKSITVKIPICGYADSAFERNELPVFWFYNWLA